MGKDLTDVVSDVERGAVNLCDLKKQFKYRKPICPFICSTFQDFQVERDILVKKVFPAIDALCRERGTFCAPIDLRWGINDHQVSNGQVVNLCLDYVTKCAPFFICILGERYGSHRPHNGPPLPESFKDLPPDAHWMDKNLVIAASSGYDWVTTGRYQGNSVTALEIAQRNHLSMELGDDFSFYYFRQQEHFDYLFTDLPEDKREAKMKLYEPESEHCVNELQDLKASIVKRGITVKYFKTPEELRQMVLDDWVSVVNCLYPPFDHHIPDIYKETLTEWMAHESFAESRRRVFVRTPELNDLFEELTQFAMSSLDEPLPNMERNVLSTFSQLNFSNSLRKKKPPEKPDQPSCLLLVGERGSGKSSVIANWIKNFTNDHPEVKLISHFVGSSAHSTDINALMRRFTHEIRNEYPDFQGNPSSINSSNNDDVSDFHHVCEAFQAALELGPCVLVLDGLDELGETYGCTNNQVKEMAWLPCLVPAQCRIIMTSVHSDTSHKALMERQDTNTLTVPLLKQTSDKSQVVKRYLAMHCKCLDDKQLDRIINSKLSDRPIFLTVLANELRVYGVYSCLDYHLESYLEAASIRDLWSKIIKRWIKDYGWGMEEMGKADNGDSENTELNGWVADLLRLLAVSRSGLSRSEILNLLEQLGYNGNSKVTMLDWAVFRSAAYDSLLERPGGLINYFHQHFKEAVEHTLFGCTAPATSCTKHSQQKKTGDLFLPELTRKTYPSRQDYHNHIADYYISQNHNCRRSEELPWQLEKAEQFGTLTGVLSEPRLFLEMAGDRIMHRKRLELVMYWKILTTAGYNITETYWKMLKTALGNEVGEPFSPQCIDIIQKRKEQHQCNSPLTQESLQDLEGYQRSNADIPRILMTSPSHSSSNTSLCHVKSSSSIQEEAVSETGDQNEEELLSSDVLGKCSERRPSSDSSTSTSSISSYVSSVDPSEAFIDGRARGPRELARLTMSTGQFLSIMSCFVDAEKMLLTAHDKLEQVSFSAECQRLLCGLEESIGNMYLYQLRKDDAARWYNMALKTVDEHLAVLKNSEYENMLLEMKGRLLDQLGNMKTYSRDFRPAEFMLSRAKMCFEKSKSTIGIAIVHYHIGFLRMQQGDFPKAELLFHQSLSCIERWFGKNHPRGAEVLNDLAALLCHPDNKQSQNLAQAESLHRRALHIRETCFGPDHLLVATSLFHLGKLLKAQKNNNAQADALEMLQRALDIRTTRLGDKHGLTKAVRRALNDLEVTLVSRTKPAGPEMRNEDLPYSPMTWHEQQLKNLKKKSQQKLEKQLMERKLIKNAQHLSKSDPLVGSDIIGQGEKEADHSESESRAESSPVASDNDNVDDTSSVGSFEIDTESTGVSNTSFEETGEGGAPTQNTYIDSFVFEMPKLSFHNMPSKKPTYRAGNFSTKSVPVTLSYRKVAKSSFSGPQSRSDVFTFYSALARRKRLYSAPITKTPPSLPSSSHGRACCVPGPHTIDIHNAHLTVYGPNTNMCSLLGKSEGPHCNAISSGIQHTSAWYHIPGRYRTTEKPFPPKRLQKRTHQQRSHLSKDITKTQQPLRYLLTKQSLVTSSGPYA